MDLKKFGLEPVPKDKLGHWREELAEEGPRPSPVSWHKEAGAGKRGFFDVRWGSASSPSESLGNRPRRRRMAPPAKIFSPQPEKVPEWVEDRGRPVKHVQRAQIILLSAERLPVLEIGKRVGISRPMVWRWQQRFAEQGIEGLLRDKTRPPGIPPVPQAKVHAVVERTLREAPGAVTHWTGRAMAKAMGLSLRTIQRIWAAHKLQPHRIRTFLVAPENLTNLLRRADSTPELVA